MEKKFNNISDYVNIKHLYSSLTYKYHVISYTVYQIITRFITLIISLVIPSRLTPCQHFGALVWALGPKPHNTSNYAMF